MFLMEDLRKFANDLGHTVGGEVHTFLSFIEDKIASVTPHVSFGRPDPVQPTVAPAQVVVNRGDFVAPALPVEQVEPAAEPAPVDNPVDNSVPVEPAPTAEATPVEDHPGS